MVLKRLLLGGGGWLAETAQERQRVRCTEGNTVRYKPHIPQNGEDRAGGGGDRPLIQPMYVEQEDA